MQKKKTSNDDRDNGDLFCNCVRFGWSNGLSLFTDDTPISVHQRDSFDNLMQKRRNSSVSTMFFFHKAISMTDAT